MREHIPVTISIDERPVRSVTRHISASAHVLVITTTIADPEHPVDLHSAYVGERGAETQVTHLALLADTPGGELSTSTHPAAAMPVAADERHGCLYDHLDHLLALLQNQGHSAAIRLDDRAIELIDR